ncbi:hypothetical protein R6Q59_024624 [Mikania micrantha]
MSMGGNNFGDEYMCVYETDQVFADAKVTLDEVDLFWRKLDLNPSLVNEDEGADIDAQLDRVIQHIKLQPNPVKKSMMSKVFSAVSGRVDRLEGMMRWMTDALCVIMK